MPGELCCRRYRRWGRDTTSEEKGLTNPRSCSRSAAGAAIERLESRWVVPRRPPEKQAKLGAAARRKNGGRAGSGTASQLPHLPHPPLPPPSSTPKGRLRAALCADHSGGAPKQPWPHLRARGGNRHWAWRTDRALFSGNWGSIGRPVGCMPLGKAGGALTWKAVDARGASARRQRGDRRTGWSGGWWSGSDEKRRKERGLVAREAKPKPSRREAAASKGGRAVTGRAQVPDHKKACQGTIGVASSSR